MKGLYFFLAFVYCTAKLNAQTYNWTITAGSSTNSDMSFCVKTDALGNVYIAGTCYSSPIDFDPSADTAIIHYPGAFIAKYDPSGNCLWAKHTGQGECVDMVLDNSGSIYITGNFNDSIDINPSSFGTYLYSNGGRDIFLCKYDLSGSLLWGHSFGEADHDYGLKLEVDFMDNVYITGYYYSTNIDFDPALPIAGIYTYGGSDAFLAKYDPSGNYLWAMTLGGPNGDSGRGIAVDQFNNVYTTGSYFLTGDFDPTTATATLNAAGGADIYIAKYSPTGSYISAISIGGTSGEVAFDIEVDNTNHLLVAGYFTNTCDFDPGTVSLNLTSDGSADIFFAKYSNSLSLVFAKRVGGIGDDRAMSMATDTAGSIYIGGYFKNTVDFNPGPADFSVTATGTNTDIYSAKYNSMGDFVWANTAGNTGEDKGQSITVLDNGNVYLTGWFSNTVDFDPGLGADNHSSNGLQDIFLTKYYNPITSIEPSNKEQTNNFKLYPNPSNGQLFCELNETTKLFIYNAFGAVVFNQELSAGKHTLDISFLPSGIYLCKSTAYEQGPVIVKQ